MSYSKLFSENAGRQIEVIMVDGELFAGKLCGYISSADNDPEPESIIVNNVELYTNEIKIVNIL